MLKELSSIASGIAVAISVSVAGLPAHAEEKTKPIVYAHFAAVTGLAITSLTRMMLESIGYTVEQKLLETGLVYQALGTGNADLFSSSYLPSHQFYLNRYEGKLDIISTSYGPVNGYLAVPAYVDEVDSIEDLLRPEVAALFDGTIVAAEAGSGVVRVTENVIKEYGITMRLATSSDAAMTAAVQAAYKEKAPIVFVGSCPHYLCAVYPQKILEDPKEVYPDNRDMHIARAGFRSDFPDATKLIARINLSDDQMAEMLLWIKGENLTPEQAAERFIEENPDLIWYWTGDLNPDLQKPEMLEVMK